LTKREKKTETKK